MSSKPNPETEVEKPPEGKTWRQVLEEHLAGPIPYLTAEEIGLARERNRKVLQLTPYGGPKRKWKPFVDKVSACREHEPTSLDELGEIREAVARAAREARMRADPLGTGLYCADE